MSLLRLSFNLLSRDWRAGEWRVLMLALVLAVGSISTVGMLADRVRLALGQQAASLLGADMRITSTRPISPQYRSMANARGLKALGSLTFPSMVSRGDQVVLCEIQSVETGYPLRGTITIADSIVHAADDIPAPGTLCVDERLMRRLNLSIGDEVGIGMKRFIVAARIVKDIDQSVGFASIAPRVLMNEADVKSTGLLQEGSRISYRLMIAGDAAKVAVLREALHPTPNERLEDVRDARPEIRIALERAEHFMGLAALTVAILAGVAIALAARRYVARHLDICAVMRCLGAVQAQVLRLFLYQFMLAGVLAVFAGLLLGYAIQDLLAGRLMAGASLPGPGFMPALQAAASGFALLIGFAYLPLLQLRRVPPLRVLRRELGLPEVSGWLVWGLAVSVLILLFLWQAGSMKLGLTVLGALFAGLLSFGLLAWLLLHLVARYRMLFSSWLQHALGNLSRNAMGVAVQVTALSLGGMALLVLTLVKGDLLHSWQGKLPPDTPNRFIVNIQPDQLEGLREFFASRHLAVPELLPMVKGRLVAINQQRIDSASYPDPRAKSLVEREFNLSYAEKMPVWNELVAGAWWRDSENADQLSVEEGIAKTLGIHLGDRLTYDVAGSRFSARVTSLRRVQWDSMKVNFFVIGTPALMRGYPESYLTSFHLPAGRVGVGDELIRAYPNLLLIDTDEVIGQVRGIIDRVSQAIGAVFMFTLMSGLLVLYAALLSNDREHEAAILRTLGAQSAYLRCLYLSEFALTGALAGLFSAAGATGLGWLLARDVLEIPYGSDWSIWLAGLLGGALLVALTGWLNTRRLGRIPPLRILLGE